MNISKYSLYVAAIAALSIAGQVRAQSCNTILTLNNLEAWITAPPPGSTRVVQFNLVSYRSDGAESTYAESASGTVASMSYSPVYIQWVGNVPVFWPYANLQGDAQRYFSDRRYSTNGYEYFGGTAPFNPLASWYGTGYSNQPAAENVHLTISLSSIPGIIGPFGTVTVTSANGSSQSFTPTCQDGILYGFATAGTVTTLYAMSLTEAQFSIPQ